MRQTTVIIFRSLENGISSTRGYFLRSVSMSVCEARTIAVSVGSPDGTPSWLTQFVHAAAIWSSFSPLSEPAAILPEPSASSCTDIRFCVSVPVLSVHITLAPPSVSTAGSRRTMARCAAMRLTPMASVMVTTAGSPSGMAATARLMDIRSISSGFTCWKSPIIKITKHMISAPMPSFLPMAASLRCNGVCGADWLTIRRAILPTWVSIPVSTTMPCPWPDTMELEE